CAMREPGGFGMAMSSPNTMQESRGAGVIREEISNFGARRAVVESITWSSSVGDLYYQNKDGSTVAAGGGGGGSASITEQDLSGNKPSINPQAQQSAEQRLQDTRRQLDDAQQRLNQEKQKLADAQPDAALSAEAPVQEYIKVMQWYHAISDPQEMKKAGDQFDQ